MLLPLHQTLLRLLQDDDEDIRRGASEMIAEGLGARRPVVNAKAIDMWWAWLKSYLVDPDVMDEWVDWLWELCIDVEGFGEISGHG